MTKLEWGASGTRFFEAGTDRGVLYLPGMAGVPWNGLTGVKEAPSGGDPVPYYLDGQKYQNISSSEEYAATVEAFSSPMEFDVCDGTASVHNGLFITQQPRKPFSLSYRTKIGNDVDGLDHGYKIHLVYNALASPANYENTTISDTAEPLKLSWDISTIPVSVYGHKSSAHLILDSRYTDPVLMTIMEDTLYGNDVQDPSIPEAQAIANLYSLYGDLIITPLALGEYDAKGGPVQIDGPATFTIDDESVTDNGDGSFTITY